LGLVAGITEVMGMASCRKVTQAREQARESEILSVDAPEFQCSCFISRSEGGAHRIQIGYCKCKQYLIFYGASETHSLCVSWV